MKLVHRNLCPKRKKKKERKEEEEEEVRKRKKKKKKNNNNKNKNNKNNNKKRFCQCTEMNRGDAHATTDVDQMLKPQRCVLCHL